MFDLNPLEVLNKRSLSHIPPHFAKFKIDESGHFLSQTGIIESWVRTRLRGRYSIAKLPSIDKDGHLKTATFVAFEDQKELTYFMLACPHLRRN
jgi:hypothetical protein